MADYPTYDTKRTFDIHIPGFQDVFILPPLESPELKRERIRRIQASNTALPDWLKRVPEWINWIDDCQDFLIVALLTARPLLKLLPTRALPVLGWLLLGNDVLNLFSMLLGLTTQPRIGKLNFMKTARNIVAGRRGRLALTHTFLNTRFPWVPYIIQGGQVLYSFTGWGLRLGGVMQSISDAWWAFLRSKSPDDLRITGPPPSDIVHKAARVLYNLPLLHSAAKWMNETEITIVTLAVKGAIDVMKEQNKQETLNLRITQLAGLEKRPSIPWERATVSALLEHDWDELFEHARPAWPTDNATVTLADGTKIAIADAPDIDRLMARAHQAKPTRFPLGLIAGEAALGSWEAFMNAVDLMVPDLSPMERLMGAALESGFVPPWQAHFGPPWDEFARFDADGISSGPQQFSDPELPGDLPKPPFRFQPPFPPPQDDPPTHLVHWLRVALSIFCRAGVWYPTRFSRVGEGYSDELWFRGAVGDLHSALSRASMLVWGNIYLNPRPDWQRPPKNELHHIRWCYKGDDGYPTLSAAFDDAFDIRDLYSPWTELTPQGVRASKTTLFQDELFGSTWFNTWVQTHPWPFYGRRETFGPPPDPSLPPPVPEGPPPEPAPTPAPSPTPTPSTS